MALYIVCVLVIVLYGHFLRATKTRDALGQRLYHHPVLQDIDGWSVSHFLFFGLLGVLYPGRHLQFFTMGVLWEVIETALGQNEFEVSGKRLQLIGEQDAEGNLTGKKGAFWYGKESDIIVDVAGYVLGSWFAEKYWPNNEPEAAQTATAGSYELKTSPPPRVGGARRPARAEPLSWL